MPVFDFFTKSSKTMEEVATVQEPQVTLREEEKRRLMEIPADYIRPNPSQPRKSFHDDGIEELSESIRQVGLIQPLVVRRMDGHYELVAGERRLRACKLLGMSEIPCLVQQDVFEEDSAMMALVENLQRENLHYLEEAECYATLISTFNLTQEELAQRLGRSQSSIANKLRVLRLSPDVKKAMTQARMTERHARTLLRIRDESLQLSIVDKVKQKGLSVKDTERLVDKTLNKLYDEKQDGAVPRPKIVRYIRDYRLFLNSIEAATKQLEDSGVSTSVEKTDTEDGGMDIVIRIRRTD